MNISPARVAAFEILSRIENEQAFSSVLLPQYENELSAQDRGLCHAITLGTLRRQILLDRYIDHFTNGKKVDPAVRIALRLGMFQLLFLDRIPDHSAINESVNLVQFAKKTSAKGFVNAILRRATRERVKLSFSDAIERISVETSHPSWLIEKWIEQFGVMEAERLASANNDIPQIAFRFTKRFKGPRPERVFVSDRVEGCFTAETIDENLLRLAEDGEIYFQDEASQMVAASIEIKEGERFLDVCSAPGSKSTAIAENLIRRESGTSDFTSRIVVAGDLHFQRVKFTRSNFQTQGLGDPNVLQYDAAQALPFAGESFDTVLVDAPCSGTGTIRHNPEIRYFIEPKDFRELPAKQLSILQNASNVVRRGGHLVYSTCSLEKEENEAVCDRFLAQNLSYQKVMPNVPTEFIGGDQFVHTLPHRDHMDGFFVACFERTANLNRS